ncbi:uncharacterized protein LOC110037172 [Phalaenopsis equestris]|uniref:uncharacterized protein LOC110037172 n=1 Tax=Phalaenopsis equestris TaxID=78828 RepID=UPI0009E5ED63|nr:uncharacterized protein LOC110037172 [Phalaenopsis equestris]
MGCGSSKSLAKSVSTREEFIAPLQKKTSGYEEILVSKNATDHQFITLLCTPSTLAKQLKEQESPKQSSPIRNNNATQTESFNSPYPVIEAEESENNIETINSWELLAGLEDEDEVETGSSKSLNTIKQCSESSRCDVDKQDETLAAKQEGEGDKGVRRKFMAAELAALKVPAMGFARTGSLRDWLTQGGQATSNGSHVRTKHGSSEHPGGKRSGDGCEENAFHPDLVAQLEQAMEDLTMEEEEILSQIVEKWEGLRVL